MKTVWKVICGIIIALVILLIPLGIIKYAEGVQTTKTHVRNEFVSSAYYKVYDALYTTVVIDKIETTYDSNVGCSVDIFRISHISATDNSLTTFVNDYMAIMKYIRDPLIKGSCKKESIISIDIYKV